MALAYSLKKRSHPSPIYNPRRLRELPIPRTGRIFVHDRNDALKAIFQENTQNQNESASENVEENIVQPLPIDVQQDIEMNRALDQAEDLDCKPVIIRRTSHSLAQSGYEDFNNLLNNTEGQNEETIASSSQVNAGTMSKPPQPSTAVAIASTSQISVNTQSPSIPQVHAPPVPSKIQNKKKLIQKIIFHNFH